MCVRKTKMPLEAAFEYAMARGSARAALERPRICPHCARMPAALTRLVRCASVHLAGSDGLFLFFVQAHQCVARLRMRKPGTSNPPRHTLLHPHTKPPAVWPPLTPMASPCARDRPILSKVIISFTLEHLRQRVQPQAHGDRARRVGGRSRSAAYCRVERGRAVRMRVLM